MCSLGVVLLFGCYDKNMWFLLFVVTILLCYYDGDIECFCDIVVPRSLVQSSQWEHGVVFECV